MVLLSAQRQPKPSPEDAEAGDAASLHDSLVPLNAVLWTIGSFGLASCLGDVISSAEACSLPSDGEAAAAKRRPPASRPPGRPGTLGYMTQHQEQQLVRMEQLLADDPPLVVTAHAREGRKRRLVRFLRADKFDPEVACCRIREHAQWWLDYGMDEFEAADELDEQGIVFACGEDRLGQPTLIARPCAHRSSSHEESVRAVRRCVFTMQRCVERLPPGREQINLIYDCWGVRAWNWDFAFSQELLRVFSRQFPERLGRVVVINSGWLVATLWATVRSLMDPVTREKICFCDQDFKDELLALVQEDHPYLCYALEVQKLTGDEGAEVPLPKASPYVPRWREAVATDARDTSADLPTAECRQVVEMGKPSQQVRTGRPHLRRLAGIFLRSAPCCST